MAPGMEQEWEGPRPSGRGHHAGPCTPQHGFGNFILRAPEVTEGEAPTSETLISSGV